MITESDREFLRTTIEECSSDELVQIIKAMFVIAPGTQKAFRLLALALCTMERRDVI